jgi:hypothetical protein
VEGEWLWEVCAVAINLNQISQSSKGKGLIWKGRCSRCTEALGETGAVSGEGLMQMFD